MTRSPAAVPQDKLPIKARRRYGRQMLAIGRLAVPVSLSRLGILLLIIVDSAMTGHYSGVELAYFGLGAAVNQVLLLIGIGMLIGTAVLVAQALGAGAEHECGVIWRVALAYASVLGVAFGGLALAGEWFFLVLGQDADLARGGAKVLLAMALGFPAAFVFVASTLFLEALGRAGPGFVMAVAGNVVNVALNWLLISGALGLPGLGAQGAALATSIVRWLIALALVVYILRLSDGARYNLIGPLREFRQIGRKLRRLGYPLGLAQGLESSAFSALALFAGYLGAEALAGYQVAMSVAAFLFMSAVGIGTATAVSVAGAVGRRDSRSVPLAGWSGLVAIVLVMLCFAVILVSLPEAVARLFSDEPGVLAVAAAGLVVVGIMAVPDGAQGVLMGALRGAGDVWVPTALHLCSFMFVMVPAAWLFALALGFGVPGLFAGAACGVTCATALLGARFAVISRREIRRL